MNIVKRAVFVCCLATLAGCVASAPSQLPIPPHYRAGDCFRYTMPGQHKMIGQVQLVKDVQYYVLIQSDNGTNYHYYDLIPFTRLEQTGTPTPCPSGTPYSIPSDAPVGQKAPQKQP